MRGILLAPPYLLYYLLAFGDHLNEGLDDPKPVPGGCFRQVGETGVEKKEIKPAPEEQAFPQPRPQGLRHLLRLLGSSSVVVEDEQAHGHGQVGPSHAGLAAEEQRWWGSARVPQQQTGALLGEGTEG